MFNGPDGIVLNEINGSVITVYVSDTGNGKVKTIKIE